MLIKTYRMSGAGNLFTVIDNRKYCFTDEQCQKLAVMLCNINDLNDYKSEGFMALNNSTQFDFEVLFFNPDGSSGMMCGNGGRCAVNFAAEINKIQSKNNISFRMSGENYSANIVDGNVELILPKPISCEIDLEINLDNAIIQGSYVNVGSDHFVINKNSMPEYSNKHLKDFDLVDFGPKIRFHNYFSPKGVNCNIYQTIDNIIYMRTYERGVEAETGACGTGAISTVLSSFLKAEIELPVKVFPTSGEALEIDIIFKNNQISYFKMLGPAIITDTKTFDIKDFN